MKPIEILILDAYAHRTGKYPLLKCKNADGKEVICTLERALERKYGLVEIGDGLTLDSILDYVSKAIIADSATKSGGDLNEDNR